MAIISTGSLSKALQPGLNSIFGLKYNEHPLECMEIFDLERSEKNFEEDVNFYGTGLAKVKPEGQAVSYDEMKQGFIKRYQHVVYALGMIITEEAIEDNLYMEPAKARTSMLARTMRQTKENVCANVLNNAFDSDYTGADGKELCATDHVLSKGGSFQNTLTTQADLSEASIEQAVTDIMDLVDDAGLKISVMPRKLIIPTALWAEADRITKSSLQNDSANNAINVINGVFPEGVKINHYLTDSDAFFIKTDCPDGLKLMQRRDVKLDNDTDFNSNNMQFKATERYSVGWTDPRGIYGSQGA